MIRTRLVRLGTAVAAAALMVPALVPTATAAAPTPKVPSLDAVTKIYPHFAGGSVFANPLDKVYGPAKKCGKTKQIKGATGNSASYMTADAATPTGAAPSVFVVAYRLPSAAKAKGLLTDSARSAKKCPAGGVVILPEIKSTKVKKLKVNLGDSSQGYTVTVVTDSGTFVNNVILVRKGKFVVSTMIGAQDGQTPAVKASVKAAQLAVKTAG